MRAFSSRALFLVALTAFGCTGAVSGDRDSQQANGDDDDSGGSDDDGEGGASSLYKCDREAAPKATPLRRLTTTQYRNTLRDLLGFALKDKTQATGVLSQTRVKAALTKIVDDKAQTVKEDRFGSYRRLAQDVSASAIEASYEVALAVASELTNSTRLRIVVGPCANDGSEANDEKCLVDFINRFGTRAWRRPLAEDDVSLMKTFYGTSVKADPLAYADVIVGMLTVPHFLYHVEHGSDELEQDKPKYHRLDDFELASRLSYQFTQSMPDDALFEAAQKGELTNDSDAYARHVDRLMQGDAAKATLDEFFYDQFKLFPSTIRDLDKLTARNGDPGFKKFAGTNLPTESTGQHMRDEVLAMTRYFTWDQPGRFKDLLTTDLSFATSDDVAKLYGVATWNGSGTPPSLPSGERPGLLTRAAFLSTGMVTSRPIIKGTFIREHVLCEHIPSPPANAANAPIDRMNKTTRESIEATTEQPGTACRGCHQSLINPLGFVTESFDALGRKRAEERLFAEDGKEYGSKPVTTTVVPQVVMGDDTEVSDAKGLVELIADSGKAEACFARGYFRFTFQRWDDVDDEGEEPTADACLVERLRRKAVGGSLVDTFKEVALSPEFKARLFD